MENSIFCAVLMKKFGIFKKFRNIIAWKVSIFRVFLVRIFPHSNQIRTRKTPNTDTFHAVHWFEMSCIFQYFIETSSVIYQYQEFIEYVPQRNPCNFTISNLWILILLTECFSQTEITTNIFIECFRKFSGHQGNNCFNFVLTSW